MHAAICDFILDCLQNSIEANATVVKLLIVETADIFSVTIKDNGIGMTDIELQKAVDPFYTNGIKHHKRKVGLGLPFMIQAVEQVEGEWSLDSEKGRGTELYFLFRTEHVDTPPIGDISGMLLQALMFDGNFELEFERKFSGNGSVDGYSLKRSELIEVLGDLNSADSLIMARQFLKSQEEDLTEGDR